MDNPTGLFKFSRAGKVTHEGISYDQAGPNTGSGRTF